MDKQLQNAIKEITGTALSMVSTQDSTAAKQAVDNAIDGATALIDSGKAPEVIASAAAKTASSTIGTVISMFTQDAKSTTEAIDNAAAGAKALFDSGEAPKIIASTIAGTILSATGNVSAQDASNITQAAIKQAKQKFQK